MVGAFVDLTLWSIRNRLRSQLRRLRQPRYLIGAIVGIAWLASLLLRGGSRGADPARHVSSPLELAAHHAEQVRFLGGLVLCGLALATAWGARAREVHEKAWHRGVFVRPIGDAIAFCPPLIAESAHLDQMFGVVSEVVREVA